MILAVWSVKGGVGATSVAALLALARAERAEDVLLVDLTGDVTAALGIADAEISPPEPAIGGSPGLVDWCGLDDPDPLALDRIALPAGIGLKVLPRGRGRFAAGSSQRLLEALVRDARTVVIDCGIVPPPVVGGDAPDGGLARQVVLGATRSLLVARPCFLNLRAAQRCELMPDGVILVSEPRRTLGVADVEAVTGAPVIAEVACDYSIARSIDAGLLAARLPRALLRTMSQAVDHVAA